MNLLSILFIKTYFKYQVDYNDEYDLNPALKGLY